MLTLRAELEGIQVGDVSVPASSLTGFQRTQLNESSGDSDARTTFAYVANADATAIEQEISFHRRPERGNFFGRSFGIASHSFKWSLRLSSTNSSSSAVEHTTVRYRVTRVLASNSSLAAPLDLNASITHQRGVPEANMTTYYVPLPVRSLSSSTRASSRAVAKVEVFDVVLLADADYSLSLAPIEHGQSARIIADAYPDRVLTAKVSFIAPSVDMARGTIDVHLDLQEPAAFLRQGMTVSVNIETGRRDQALVLPNDALRASDGTHAQVLRVRDGVVERVGVRLGMLGTALSEISEGLAAGDLVLIGDAEEGQRVRPRVQPIPSGSQD